MTSFDDLLAPVEESAAVYAVYGVVTALLSSRHAWTDEDDSEAIVPTTDVVIRLTAQLRDRIGGSEGADSPERSSELVRELSDALLRRLSAVPAISQLDGARILSELSASVGATGRRIARRTEPAERVTTRPVEKSRRSARYQLESLGVSDAARLLQEEIDDAARTNARVLITGESGTGKDTAAHLIHQWSARANAPLIAVSVAALPDSLLESQLFGRAKGFSGGHRDNPGLLERANGGTILLDEVGGLSLRSQALLLRFLETGEVQQMGSDQRTRVDVRVLATTDRNLSELVAEKTFREDLYYRLKIIHIHVPPLRERQQDIPVLLDRFLRHFADKYHTETRGVSPEALSILTSYAWPGNIRELRNLAERLVLRQERIDVAALPLEIVRGGSHRAVAQELPVANANVSTPTALFEQMRGGASFWSAVYEPFMVRDLTRDDVRALVRMGLEHTRGDYKLLLTAFNMPPADYKRFLAFLRKYDCAVSPRSFRITAGPLGTPLHEQRRTS